VSAVPRKLHRAVVTRAAHRCEYCRLPFKGQAGWFPLDHIIPKSRGGKTELNNLAFACPRCNGHKWNFLSGPTDDPPGEAPLFNPRTQRWSAHFQWSERQAFVIEALSPTGQATIARLQMNHAEIVEVRRWLAHCGISVMDS
jgi:hypothetical protein